MRLKIDREQKLQHKVEEELKVLQDKPDITTLYQSASKQTTRTKLERIEETNTPREMESPSNRKPPTQTSTQAVNWHKKQAQTKWDWLYKVGVEKVIAQKFAGRNKEDIILEKEYQEYTFSPNRSMAL